jgi:predicted ATPase
MIADITITDLKKLPTKWAEESTWLKEMLNKTIHFTDGINILVGANGSGKTTLLKIIAMYMHCNQGGRSKITRSSVETLVPFTINKKEFLNGATINHDGQICFYSGDNIVGLDSGAFDDDFFREGLDNISNIQKVSSGEGSLSKISSVVTKLEKYTDIAGRNKNVGFNESWDKNYNLSLTVYDNPTIPHGKKTIILDEPDTNLDIKNQLELFRLLKRLNTDYQIIMSAHSILSLMIKDVNIIETTENYYETAKKEMNEI